MNREERIIKTKLGLLELAKHLYLRHAG